MTDHLPIPGLPDPTDHDAGVEPISAVLVPCLDHEGNPPYMQAAPKGRGMVCQSCKGDVSHEEKPAIDRGAYKAWRSVPHLRWEFTFALKGVSSCSCGGWAGTPVSIGRQLTGAEDLILSFQGKVDDIEHNQAQSVDLLCQLNERIDRLIELLSERR